MNNKLEIVTFNPTGLNQERVHFIKNHILSGEIVDIMFLQETWLLKTQMQQLSGIHKSYLGDGISGMDEEAGIIQGRRYGGVGILWHKRMAHIIKPYKTKHKRIHGVIMTPHSGIKILMLNLYLPCDNYHQHIASVEYMETLNKVEIILNEVRADRVLLGGDLNTDLSRDNAHSKLLRDMCNRHGLQFAWHHSKATPTYTYMSSDLRSKSTIDHFICSNEMYSDINNVCVNISAVNPSWHRSAHISFNLDFNTIPVTDQGHTPMISWGKVTDIHYEKYRRCLSEKLQNISVPNHVFNCNDVLCSDSSHKQQLSQYCSLIIQSCIDAGENIFPKTKQNKSNKPYWNSIVREKQKDSLFWGRIWRECGQPRDGFVADIMRKTKREYHYAARYIKRNEDTLRKMKMSECLLFNRDRDFWMESKKMRDMRVNPPHVDNKCDPNEISDIFANKYKNLYNSVPPKESAMTEIEKQIHEGLKQTSAKEYVVTYDDVKSAIRSLKPEKSDGDLGLWSNHIIHGGDILTRHLSRLITAMLIHGFSPGDLTTATIVSIIKDKHGNHCESANYRGIALSSGITKVYDIVTINKYHKHLETSGLQFAFKSGHSTVMCNLTMKEIVTYYINRGSKVYACFLDATKAFDRIRYDKLFQMLIDREMPCIIVRSLLDMYQRQKVRTTWQGSSCEYFDVCNGIKQGGILSPLLYTVYADELFKRLKDAGIGCYIGHIFAGALGYADDMKLLCPSIRGLQKMVNICRDFGIEYDVWYNEKKTVCMCFSKQREMDKFSVYLNGKELDCVDKVKHVGITVRHNLQDDSEIRQKRGDFIGRTNYVLAKYSKMSSDIKTKMFNTYCTHMYGCETWNVREQAFDSLCTSWNIAIRSIWQLPRDAHRCFLPGLSGTEHIRTIIFNKIMQLYRRMMNSNNELVSFVTKCCMADARSIMRKNSDYILNHQNFDNRYQLEEIESQVAVLKEVRLCLDGIYKIDGFSNDELTEMYEYTSNS